MLTLIMVLVVIALVVALVCVTVGAVNGDIGCQFAFMFGSVGKLIEVIGTLVIAIVSQNE